MSASEAVPLFDRCAAFHREFADRHKAHTENPTRETEQKLHALASKGNALKFELFMLRSRLEEK